MSIQSSNSPKPFYPDYTDLYNLLTISYYLYSFYILFLSFKSDLVKYHDRIFWQIFSSIAFQRAIDGQEINRAGELRRQIEAGIPTNCGADLMSPLSGWFDLPWSDREKLSRELGLRVDELNRIAIDCRSSR